MYITWTNLWIPCKLLGGCHGKEVDAIEWNLVRPWHYYIHKNGFKSSILWRGRWLETRNVRSYVFLGDVFCLEYMGYQWHCWRLSIFLNNAASSCWSFWNTWSVQGNALFVSCPYFWIMLHQFVNIFGIHGLSVTLLWI